MQVWCNNSHLPVDHIVAGSFETAMRVIITSCNINIEEYSVSEQCPTPKPQGWMEHSSQPIEIFPTL